MARIQANPDSEGPQATVKFGRNEPALLSSNGFDDHSSAVESRPKSQPGAHCIGQTFSRGLPDNRMYGASAYSAWPGGLLARYR
jgi:hypothetical protein